ncbi:MAG TPA: NUDIX hydrolase [Candidatus Binataceae bacterium]|nr:NUDIX hydrolase [Candidatus Binataceae bacterium]
MNSRRPIFHRGVLDLGLETASLPNGLTVELPVIRHPGAAAIVALDERQRVAMINQYRHAIGGAIWEIPAGARAEGENPRQCAARELREEAGVVARSWRRLATIVTVPSFCDERITLFLARQLSATASQHEADEVIRLRWIPLARALAMIEHGQIVDAKTIAALYRTQTYLAQG